LSNAAGGLLVEVTRGGIVESRHFGSAVIVDESGVRWSVGDPDGVIFPRSALKPIQAMQLVESGAADRYKVDDAELALACASHNGEVTHVSTVAAWMERIGLTSRHLVCGAHWPMLDEAARALAVKGDTPNELHNNCSGKHAGFLTTALHLGERLSGYEEYLHPVQLRWRDALTELIGVDVRRWPCGVDGCSIPSQSLPLACLALAYARFAQRRGLTPARSEAAGRIEAAMRAHPYLIAGKGRACTRIMDATEGRVLVKAGAEGVFAGWIPEAGLGFALKITDGASRAADVAVVAVIQRAATAIPSLAEPLREMARGELLSCRGAAIGDIRIAAAGLTDGP
jgi:L-asparaginase II